MKFSKEARRFAAAARNIGSSPELPTEIPLGRNRHAVLTDLSTDELLTALEQSNTRTARPNLSDDQKSRYDLIHQAIKTEIARRAKMVTEQTPPATNPQVDPLPQPADDPTPIDLPEPDEDDTSRRMFAPHPNDTPESPTPY